MGNNYFWVFTYLEYVYVFQNVYWAIIFFVKLWEERYNIVGYTKFEEIDTAIRFDKFHLLKIVKICMITL